ncbi:MAG: hypothetical protein FWG21_05980 [Oscillospiraceae bacterium]|nr:hypothetical protein [Oscillospiraceae bacterium]
MKLKDRTVKKLSLSGTKRTVLLFVIFAFGVILLEVLLFNFRYFESMSFIELRAFDYETEITGMTETDVDGCYHILDRSNATVTFNGISNQIKNIHIDAKTFSREYVDYRLTYDDAGNSYGQTSVTLRSVAAVERSQYHRVFLNGITDTMTVSFMCDTYDTLEIKNISFNSRVPFVFSPLRMMVLFALICVCYLLRPRGEIWQLQLLSKNMKTLKIIVSCTVAIVFIIIFRILTTSNSFFVTAAREYDSQYHRLAEALSSGRLSLLDSPPDWLVSMSNPYDLSARIAMEAQTGEIALWDHAYFDGAYYCYFGVLPAVFYYLPYYLITGTHAPSYFGIYICLIAFTIFSMLLVAAIIKRWFNRTGFCLYIILSSLFIMSSGAVYIAHRPDFYSFPIILSLAMTTGSLFLYISAKKPDGLSCIRLLFASLLMSLNALSRPQFLITFIPVASLLFEEVFTNRNLFSKKSIKQTTALVLPVIAVAALTMWYNFMRFGSVLDFGANYNLTSNDMTVRGFVFERIWPGLFVYLIQPGAIDLVFPYIKPVSLTIEYVGTNINEATFGGLFATNAFAVWSLLILKAKQIFLGSKEIIRLLVTLAVSAITVVIADTEMAGILPRYYPDFTFMLLLIAIFVLLRLFMNYQDSSSIRALASLRSLIVVTMLVTFGFQFLLCFTDISYPLRDTDPVKFQQIASLFAFMS